MNPQFRFDPVGVYRCEPLLKFDFARHGFGSRAGNPAVDVTLRQIHSDIVENASALADREREGDALISNVAGRAIGIRTADCVPILLLDSQTHAVAAIHAGWRGTASSIVTKAIARLRSDFGSDATNLSAAIGPCIRECCYEVGPEVAKQFVSQFPEWVGDPGQRHIDLPEANRRQLIAAGVPEYQIYDSGMCTACSLDVLFSYRREPANPGRMIASIARLW